MIADEILDEVLHAAATDRRIADAVRALGRALERGTDRLDLYGGHNTDQAEAPGFTLLISEDQPCDDVMGALPDGDTIIAFAQAPTLAEALILLAGRMADAGYGGAA